MRWSEAVLYASLLVVLLVWYDSERELELELEHCKVQLRVKECQP